MYCFITQQASGEHNLKALRSLSPSLIALKLWTEFTAKDFKMFFQYNQYLAKCVTIASEIKWKLDLEILILQLLKHGLFFFERCSLIIATLHMHTNVHTVRYSICMHTPLKLFRRLHLPKKNYPVVIYTLLNLSHNAFYYQCLFVCSNKWNSPSKSLVNVTSGYVKENIMISIEFQRYKKNSILFINLYNLLW